MSTAILLEIPYFRRCFRTRLVHLVSKRHHDLAMRVLNDKLLESGFSFPHRQGPKLPLEGYAPAASSREDLEYALTDPGFAMCREGMRLDLESASTAVRTTGPGI